MIYECTFCEKQYLSDDYEPYPYRCSDCFEMYQETETPPEEMIDHDPGL